MIVQDIIKQIEEKNKTIKKLQEIQKNSGKDSPDYKNLKTEIENKYPNLYLEEDCNLLTGGGFKKGRQIILDEIKRFYQLGFYYLWVTDKSISEEERKKDFIYNYKTELENVLAKTMVLIDENDGKKPGSSIKYIEKNDLLKQTIEVIQSDGAKFIVKKIFGESGKKIDSVKTLVRLYYKKGPNKIDLFNHINLGDFYKTRGKQSEKKSEGQTEEERSNFILQFMIDTLMSFMATMANIQQVRMLRDPQDRPDINRKLDPSKRHGYITDHLIEGALGAVFADYGFLHFAIDEILTRFTTPFLNKEGILENSGFAQLSEKNQLIFDKHCNVSYNLFASLKEQGFVQEIARDILQYHHRGLNDTGYPRRKMVDERVQDTDLEGNVFVHNQKIYETKILEMTRLVFIITFFIEYYNQTPLHIPFQRDNLVRHLLLNSVYPPGENNMPDQEGIYEIQTQLPQNKRFDGYLVDMFLKSINIYKIGEQIPVYNFNNTNNKVYDAEVIRYNDMPHRPVIKVLNDNNQEIDLSDLDNESLYIGEYVPSLRFQDVIDNFHLDKVDGGITLVDQKAEGDYELSLKKEERETAAMLDDLWDHNPQVTDSIPQVDTSDFNIDDLLANIPPELAKAQEANKIKQKDVNIQPIEEPHETQPQFDDIEINNTQETLSQNILIQEIEPEKEVSEIKQNSDSNSIKNDILSSKNQLDEDDLMNIFAEPELQIDSKNESTPEEIKLQEPMPNDQIDDLFADISEPQQENKVEPGNLQISIQTKKSKMDEDIFDNTISLKQEDGHISPEYSNKLYTIYLKKDDILIPYGLGKLISSKKDEKTFKMKYLSQFIEESNDYYRYHYSEIFQDEQKIISIINHERYKTRPYSGLKFFLGTEYNDDTYDQTIEKTITEGSYHLLYYIEELNENSDSSIDPDKGVPKYIVQVQDSINLIVTFIRYIKIQDHVVKYIKDTNCGKDFDLNNYKYFRLGREISAKELVKYLNLKLV